MRNRIMLAVLALLSACTTVPDKAGFNKAQVAAMTELGFKPAGENYELGLEDRVLFEVDKSELGPEANAVLGRIAQTLLKVGIRGSDVAGHTDSSGSDQYNLALSERRATSVKAGLVTAGMDPARVMSQGLGESQPIASNATEEGRAQNRRVVIIVGPEDVE